MLETFRKTLGNYFSCENVQSGVFDLIFDPRAEVCEKYTLYVSKGLVL
jgi:hypothetical protein